MEKILEVSEETGIIWLVLVVNLHKRQNVNYAKRSFSKNYRKWPQF